MYKKQKNKYINIRNQYNKRYTRKIYESIKESKSLPILSNDDKLSQFNDLDLDHATLFAFEIILNPFLFTLCEYLERLTKFKMPEEQSRLICEIPKIIGDDGEVELECRQLSNPNELEE